MKEYPLITIITVTYNAAQWLERCVESVIMQQRDGFNIEHLIIDGASTDGTVELIDRLFTEGKISRFISEPDAGIYDAMNKGLALAQGEIISYLNADDYYLDGRVVSDLIMPIVKNTVEFTFANALVVDTAGQEKYVWYPDLACAFSETPFNHQTLFHRIGLLRDVGGFDMSFRSVADADFKAKLLISKKPYQYIDRVCVCFQDGGMSSQFYRDEVARLYVKYEQENVAYCQETKYIGRQVERLQGYVLLFSEQMMEEGTNHDRAVFASSMMAPYCLRMAEMALPAYSFYFIKFARHFEKLAEGGIWVTEFRESWVYDVQRLDPKIFHEIQCLKERSQGEFDSMSKRDRAYYYKLLRRLARKARFSWSSDLSYMSVCLRPWSSKILDVLLFVPLSENQALSFMKQWLVRGVTYYCQFIGK